MAHIATNTYGHISLGKTLAKPFVAIGHFLVKLGEANSRAKTVQRLNDMSDAELARIGLAREDIVRHVFRDYMYL